MANSIKTDDIKFQPAVKTYSYSSPRDLYSNKIKPFLKIFKYFILKYLSTFITLVLGVLLILLITGVILVALNYFKVISLYNLNPGIFSFLPISQLGMPLESTADSQGDGTSYSNETKSWTTTGTLYGYKEDIIQVKSANKVFEFKFTKNTSFSISDKQGELASDSAKTNDFYNTLYDLEKQENLGKRIEVSYDKDKNILIMYLFK